MSTLLVTGANGFVGRHLVARAIANGTPVRAAVRRAGTGWPTDVTQVLVPAVSADADWRAALVGIDTVIHCAARVHRTDGGTLDEYRAINGAGTLRIAAQAARAGVRRFVFISSVKVHGERTETGRPFCADDVPHPAGPYALSKFEAERELAELGADTGLEIVTVRPVLVYGPGVRGNFESMMRALIRGIPLPFGAVDNLRSLVAVDTLVDLLLLCARHPSAVGRVFLVSDGEDLSTPDLLRRTAAALGVRARLFSVNPRLLERLAALAGKRDAVCRLTDSLQVDISATRQVLGWRPPVSMDAALARTARAFLAGQRG